MSKALTLITNQNVDLISFTEEKKQLIKNTIATGLTDAEFALFISVAARRGLDPILRQIHAVKRAGKMTIQTGIDGFRLIAARTGEYGGCDETKLGPLKGRYPEFASVTVYRFVHGNRCSFTATAHWDEYFPGEGPEGFMWKKMPKGQLAKCAEALALRKGFPGELSGIYSDDEMHQANPPETRQRVTVEIPEVTRAGSEEIQTKTKIEVKASAPVTPNAGDYVVSFGKDKGKRLSELSPKRLEDGLKFWKDKEANGEELKGKAREYVEAVVAYLGSL